MSVTLTRPVRATSDDAGCWLDSHRGWRISGAVVRMAHDFGMTHDADDIAILDAFDAGTLDDLTLSTGEVLDVSSIAECVYGQGSMCDQAEQWLNDHIAPEGYYFGFWEGDFMLQSAQWWEDESW